MATAPSPSDLTRQQLDELDALLQRMLSLPLNPAEAPSAGAFGASSATSVLPAPPLPEIPTPPPVKNWRVDPPAAPQITVPYLAAPVLPDPARVAPEPRRAPEPVSAPAPPPFRAPVALMPEPEPEPPAPTPVVRSAPKPAPAPPPAARPLPVLQPPSVTELPRRPAPVDDVPLLLWPVAALNGVVEGALGLLGPIGRILRSGFVKNVCGVAGIGLLLYTAAHLAQSGGWVALPVQLPWPR